MGLTITPSRSRSPGRSRSWRRGWMPFSGLPTHPISQPRRRVFVTPAEASRWSDRAARPLVGRARPKRSRKVRRYRAVTSRGVSWPSANGGSTWPTNEARLEADRLRRRCKSKPDERARPVLRLPGGRFGAAVEDEPGLLLPGLANGKNGGLRRVSIVSARNVAADTRSQPRRPRLTPMRLCL